MKINKINLCNFGPYESLASFDTSTNKDKNIVLIGGKNGSGKTTLFTAMRVCLYGYVGMGYKAANNHYYRNVKRLINDNAKMNQNTQSYVEMDFTINNRRNVDYYLLRREWFLDDGVKEIFTIIKNGNTLNEQEIADFEKFLLSYLPPDLFNLYFFDGEKIADFFLESGGNKRIKGAFLTICGYDVFEIMKLNFKRLASANKNGASSDIMNRYIEKKEEVKGLEERLFMADSVLNELESELNNFKAELDLLDKNFANQGGKTEADNEQFIAKLKAEEKNREILNLQVKNYANNTLPFLMMAKNLSRVRDKILLENNNIKHKHFLEILNSDYLLSKLESESNAKDIISKINEVMSGELHEVFGFNLSFEQSAEILTKINEFLAKDKNDLLKIKNMIKSSINKSASIRKEMEKSDASLYKDYAKKRTQLLEDINQAISEKSNVEIGRNDLVNQLDESNKALTKIRDEVEKALKEKSKLDIASKAILMLEDLEKVLYQKQIEIVKQNFMSIFQMLMRKESFLDGIDISSDFNISIYKKKSVQVADVIDILSNNSFDDIRTKLGIKAIDELKELTKDDSYEGIIKKLSELTTDNLQLSFVIDKDTMSNGEKQIYIMALYFSLVKLSKQEIPFVIDTPFARIDTEHRNNISNYFFKQLKGQIFILSTNEEIDADNYSIIESKIAKTYMLENTDNKKTKVVSDSYFEV